MKIILGALLIVLASTQVVRNNLSPYATARPTISAPVYAQQAPVYASAPVFAPQAPVFAPAPIAPAWGFENCWASPWHYQQCMEAWEAAEN